MIHYGWLRRPKYSPSDGRRRCLSRFCLISLRQPLVKIQSTITAIGQAMKHISQVSGHGQSCPRERQHRELIRQGATTDTGDVCLVVCLAMYPRFLTRIHNSQRLKSWNRSTFGKCTASVVRGTSDSAIVAAASTDSLRGQILSLQIESLQYLPASAVKLENGWPRLEHGIMDFQVTGHGTSACPSTRLDSGAEMLSRK